MLTLKMRSRLNIHLSIYLILFQQVKDELFFEFNIWMGKSQLQVLPKPLSVALFTSSSIDAASQLYSLR